MRENILEKVREFERLAESLKELTAEVERLVLEQRDKGEQVAISSQALEEFLEEPYLVLPKGRDEYYVIVPKFVDFSVGWLERETKTYRIFVINRYTLWLTPIPEDIRRKVRFEEPLPFKVEGRYLVTGRGLQDVAWKKYREYLSKKEGEDRIRIKRGYEFELIARLVRDGILPYVPRPVSTSDLREWDGIELRPYQRKAWQEFLEKGAIGIFWPFGAGKSYFGIYLLARVRGPKLVVVPTRTLVDMWKERIMRWIPEYADEITVITYHSYHKASSGEYTLTIFDEVHHLPANSFIRLSTIKTKYRVGLSASPYREDGRVDLIFALTGFPIGIDWKELIDAGVVRKPMFKLHVVKNETEKLLRLKSLLQDRKKTIIFCDSIALGKKISKKFGIPFVYGETKNRLDVLREAEVCVVSRVGDEGVSVPDVERVIEVAFLMGSKMQESQRFGRLMHAQSGEPEHIILMTEEELSKYRKRLYAITERGFGIEVVR